MNFIKKIGQSVYSPQFYSQIAQKSLGSALGYFFLFCFLLTIIQVSILFFSLNFTHFQPTLETEFAKVVSMYPSELVVTITKGTVSTNVKEPYVISLPGDGKNAPEKIITIDTKTPFSAAQYRDYQTPVWVTKDAIFYTSNTELKTIDLSKVSNFKLDQKAVTTFAGKVTPWLKFVLPVVIFIMFIALYIANIFRLVYLFFLALLILLATKLMKKSLSYSGAYKVGVYAMTLAFFADLVTPFLQIPFLFTLISLVVVVINFSSLPASVRVTKTASKPKKKS